MRDTVGETGIYVYGVMNINPIRELEGISGIDGICNLNAIEKNGFYIITSPVDLNIYGEGAINNRIEDMIWVEEHARRHFGTQQKLAQIGVFIPMKFCTIFTGSKTMDAFFENYSSGLEEGFAYLANKEEWTVKLYCDRKKFLECNMEEERKEIQEKAKNVAKGASYFLLKKLEASLDEKSREKIVKLKDKFYSPLKEIAEKTVINKNLSKQVTELSEDMILNVALLISKEKIKLLSEEIEKQEEQLKVNQMRMEISGPWPFYNFSNLIISNQN